MTSRTKHPPNQKQRNTNKQAIQYYVQDSRSKKDIPLKDISIKCHAPTTHTIDTKINTDKTAVIILLLPSYTVKYTLYDS